MRLIKKFFFLLLSSVIMVIFSEKTFWYIHGYQLLELFAAYLVPTIFFLWVLDHYGVNSLPTLFLAAAVFGFVTEGVLTPILYEDGPFNLMSVSYTSLGWHALISAFLGWFYLRKWLIEQDWRRITLFALGYGLFWGLWSLVFWMPENITNPQFQTPEFTPGQWPITDFVLFTFTMTAILIAAHWLIGWVWQTSFKPTKTGVIITGIIVTLIYTFQVLLSYPWAPLKLTAVMLPTLYFLHRGAPQGTGSDYLQTLAGPVRLVDCLPLLLMPLTASVMYAAAYTVNLSEGMITVISAIPGVYGLTILGWICWIGAMVVVSRRRRKSV